MGLLSIDITKKKRLSLGSIKLPEREVRIEPIITTPEEVISEPIKIITLEEWGLISTEEQIIEKQRSYSRQELIDIIGKPELYQRLKNGDIEQIPNKELFFLGGSTPF